MYCNVCMHAMYVCMYGNNFRRVFVQQRSQVRSKEGGGKERWGSGGEAPGKIFGTTPLRTLGNAHFE